MLEINTKKRKLKNPKERQHDEQHDNRRRNDSHRSCTTLVGWVCCGGVVGLWWVCRLKNFDDHLLPSLAVAGSPTDEIEQPRPVKFEDTVAVVGEEERMSRVALLVLLLTHHQNGVFLELKIWNSMKFS